ncbi:glycoside hydrolase, partial [Gymnopilus junonius]
MGYYPDWLGYDFPPTKIDFRRFDWIDFAFAVPNADATLSWDDPSAPGLLDKLVSTAHSQGSKVKLSIGGWTGSKHFSALVATNHSRETFISNIFEVYISHQLDGIEIDWEYPGHAGSSSNEFDGNDTANFLLFLRSLRASLPSGARITAAVEPKPFVDSTGRALEDVSEFAEVLDWILIMNYDLWGSSSHPGPNAPLYDACGNSTQPSGSALGSYSAWTNAQFPASKLVLGLPSYGYISSSIARNLRARSKPTNRHHHHSTTLKIASGDGDSDGQIQFRDLISQGALSPTGDKTRYYSSHGFEQLWDSCSCTPYLRSPQSKQVITFDDPTSLGMKAAFAKQTGMLGVNLFDVHGDTDDWILVDAIR